MDITAMSVWMESRVAVWLHAPGNLTAGNWRLALYVDENADDAQFEAICALWSGEGGGHLAVIASLVSNVLSAKKANISFESTPERKHLVIGGSVKTRSFPLKARRVSLSLWPAHRLQ